MIWLTYIFLGVLGAGVLLGIISGIVGLIYVKSVPYFSQNLEEFLSEDYLLSMWAKSYLKRESRRIGIYSTYLWDHDKKWWVLWHFQFMKLIKFTFLKYPMRKKKQLW